MHLPPRPHLPIAALGAAMAFAMPAAFAASGLTQAAVTAPGALATACAGVFSASGTGNAAGDYISLTNDAHSICLGSVAAGPAGVATQSATSTWNSTWSNVTTTQAGHASAAAGLGWAKLAADMQGAPSAGWVNGTAAAGWTDTLTLTALNPADNGKAAVLNFSIHLDGLLDTPLGVANGAQVRVSAWKNGLAWYSINGGNLDATLGISGNGAAHTLAVNQDLLFAMPVTLGSPFTLGVYGRTIADIYSAGGNNFVSTAKADFSHTMLWDGITSVTVGGQAVGYTLASASGIDWTQPTSAVPEPPAGALLLAGIACMGLWARRRTGEDR